jgi:hypothetical protein
MVMINASYLKKLFSFISRYMSFSKTITTFKICFSHFFFCFFCMFPTFPMYKNSNFHIRCSWINSFRHNILQIIKAVFSPQKRKRLFSQDLLTANFRYKKSAFSFALIIIVFILSLSTKSFSANQLKDEGVHKGWVTSIDCTGAGVTCSASGIQGTINVPAGGGAGDVISVGDCADGACLDGTSDGGTYIKFYDAQGAGQLITGDLDAVKVWTLPNASGSILLKEQIDTEAEFDALLFNVLTAEVDPTVDTSAEIQAIIRCGLDRLGRRLSYRHESRFCRYR